MPVTVSHGFEAGLRTAVHRTLLVVSLFHAVVVGGTQTVASVRLLQHRRSALLGGVDRLPRQGWRVRPGRAGRR